ncbi:hypothetical protein CVT25_011599 [Psilocybe cyanescens]|uniref:Uncharacterized protein n=1 Tax=Psilocybe cyanescens TaxID=93625 RepID=A0A409X0L7_PSICY|nr:hypothetical protein CVT25_011599 [Psilocybe cyanescens]
MPGLNGGLPTEGLEDMLESRPSFNRDEDDDFLLVENNATFAATPKPGTPEMVSAPLPVLPYGMGYFIRSA